MLAKDLPSIPLWYSALHAGWSTKIKAREVHAVRHADSRHGHALLT